MRCPAGQTPRAGWPHPRLVDSSEIKDFAHAAKRAAANDTCRPVQTLGDALVDPASAGLNRGLNRSRRD
jgi:hypothetical protein